MTQKTQSVSTEIPSGPVRLTAPPEAFERATGTANRQLQRHLLLQLSSAIWLPDDLDEQEKRSRIRSAFTCLQGLNPSDVAEGMLATQMVATHEAAMTCLKQATTGAPPPAVRNENLKLAAKLLAAYAHQLDTLDRHRLNAQRFPGQLKRDLKIDRIERVIVYPPGHELAEKPEAEQAGGSGNRGEA